MRLSSIVAASAVTAAVLVPASASPAAATRCAQPTGMSPRALVTGSPMWEDANGPTYVSDPDRFALVGTVTGIRTDRGGGAQHGRTQVTVEVDALFGTLPRGSRSGTVIVSQSDPGWMSGYGFEVGARYFIPLEHVGPGGMTNYSFTCDPIAQVSDVDGLVAAARRAGVVDVVVPGEQLVDQALAEPVAAEEPQEQTPARIDGDGVATPADAGGPGIAGAVGAGVALSTALLGGALWLRRGRYRRDHGAGPA